jgi:lipopolysaccharide export LptBFGC system permease protein LptF
MRAALSPKDCGTEFWGDLSGEVELENCGIDLAARPDPGTLLFMHGRWRSSPRFFVIIMTLNAAFFAYLSYRGHYGIYGEILTGLLLLGVAFHIIRMPTTKVAK